MQIRHNPSTLKPRDIVMVNLQDLQWVETESKVNTDEQKLQATQTLVDTSIDILINNHIKQRTVTLCENLLPILQKLGNK